MQIEVSFSPVYLFSTSSSERTNISKISIKTTVPKTSKVTSLNIHLIVRKRYHNMYIDKMISAIKFV